ncbi:hypothetical protein KY284_019970 [Solanum tuberosum]|nr:hypothetical protein KY284_019970 [Solanum tuberosum]
MPNTERQRLGLEAETVARGAQQHAVNNPPRVVEEHERVEEIAPPHRQSLALKGRAQQPAHRVFEEDDLDLDGAGAIRAIVLHALPLGVKFTITNMMIQLLNLNGMFIGTTGDDAHQHVINFIAICKSQEIPRVNQTAMRLRLFSLSLTGEVKNWLNEMLDDSIRTWNELKEAFLERFYPESQELQMKDEISIHKQQLGEVMHDTWWRFNQKMKKCPNHVCGGSFMRKPFLKIVQIMDEVSSNKEHGIPQMLKLEIWGSHSSFKLNKRSKKKKEIRIWLT